MAIGSFCKLAVVGGMSAFVLIRNLATAFVEDRSLAVGIIDVAVCFANGTTSMMFGWDFSQFCNEGTMALVLAVRWGNRSFSAFSAATPP